MKTMYRVGFYTGKVYKDRNAKECCKCFLAESDEDAQKQANEISLSSRCIGCNGCEENRKIYQLH